MFVFRGEKKQQFQYGILDSQYADKEHYFKEYAYNLFHFFLYYRI